MVGCHSHSKKLSMTNKAVAPDPPISTVTATPSAVYPIDPTCLGPVALADGPAVTKAVASAIPTCETLDYDPNSDCIPPNLV